MIQSKSEMKNSVSNVISENYRDEKVGFLSDSQVKVMDINSKNLSLIILLMTVIVHYKERYFHADKVGDKS